MIGDDLDLADVAVGEARLQAAKFGSKRRLKPIISGVPAFSTTAEAGLDARRSKIDRLLAEHRLAGAGAALDEVGMGVGGRADQDGVDVRSLDDLVERRDLGAGRRGERLRRGRVRVGDRDEPRIRVSGGVAAMNPADAAGAQNGDPDHVFPDIFAGSPANLELMFQLEMLIE